jgi:cation diffusion facilitator CzcD-associated flavoprotein CzcO
VQDKATAEALKPWYMHRCKRPCYDDEYLAPFNRPNVHLVDTNGKGITEINAQSVVFEGRTYPVDVLIYATGFEVQKTGIYNEIRGENGLELNDKYAEGCARCSASTPRVIRICSSWAVTRRHSSST